MTPFETAFPGFVQATADLHADLLPFAVLLIVLGTILDQAFADGTPMTLFRTYLRAFLLLLFLAHSGEFLNEGQDLVKTWVERHIPARPENVAEHYRQRLHEAQQLGDRADESFIRKVLNGDGYEAILLAFLTLVSWLAMAVVSFVYSIQRAVLLLCWALTPLLLPCLTVRPLQWIGLQHLLRLIGILLWPIGLALAATFTQGLIDTMVGDRPLSEAGFGEAVGKGLTGLLGIGVIAIWILVSTIAAPVYIQRLVSGAVGPAMVATRGGEMLASAAAGALHRGSVRARLAATDLRSAFGGGSGSGGPGFPSSASEPTPVPGAPLPPPPTPLPADPTGDAATQAVLRSQEESP